MEFEAVKAWLEKATRQRIRRDRMRGCLGMAAAPVAIVAAVGLVAVVAWLFSNFGHRAGPHGFHLAYLLVGLAAVPLMFIGNWFFPRESLVDKWAAEGVPIAGRRQQAILQGFLWVMCAGPRLFNWAQEGFQEAKELQGQDTHSCAAVLWVLISSPKKVPFADFPAKVPWLNLEAVTPDLRRIPGVLFLRAAPEGLSITQELRDAMWNGGPIG
jgi:hypothetical protein